MLLKIVYMLTCGVLGLAVLVCRGDRAKDVELLVLRHENAVLRRHAGRARYEPADRAWLAALARLIPRKRWSEVFPVTPATLLAWHRRLAAKKYDMSKQRKPGRPPKSPSITRLVARLAKENPLYVEPGIMWSCAMSPSGRGVCESGCQQDRRMRAPHNFRCSQVFEPLDDVLAGVPAGFTFRVGNEGWAAFDRFAFHRHVDLDVLTCGGDADVSEPGLDHVELDTGLE
jgi:hypothetical protein